jgi:hypothetical protein
MTLQEANEIWEACYGDSPISTRGWDTYTAEQRSDAIRVRNGKLAFYDVEADRIDRRAAERDGWQTATWDGR